MPHSASPDIVPLVKHICLSLQSFSKSRQVDIIFEKSCSSAKFPHQPCEIIHCLSQLLCRIISYLPVRSKVNVATEIFHTNGQPTFRISVHNTGASLSKIKAITNGLVPAVDVGLPSPKETVFILQIPMTSSKKEAAQGKPIKVNGQPVPVFFEEVRKRLQRYFSRTNNHLENVQSLEPRKAAFLGRINECILQHLHQEGFDATALSREMAMSRAQLFRKLKPIISQPPASYIKAIRLQKAKELLETSELTVSEVAYKTGFKTPSHFTKVFTEKFGLRPSVFATATVHATNE